MIALREEPRQRPADYRPAAEWIDVTDLVRDGAAFLKDRKMVANRVTLMNLSEAGR